MLVGLVEEQVIDVIHCGLLRVFDHVPHGTSLADIQASAIAVDGPLGIWHVFTCIVAYKLKSM